MLNPVYSALSAALAVVLAVIITVTLPAHAQDAPAKTADEIRDCSRANLPDESMAQNITLQPTDRAGKTRDIVAVFFLKRLDEEETRGTLQVRSPVDVSGVSYLWVDTGTDDRLFLYLPTVQRVRRITGKTAANSMLAVISATRTSSTCAA